MGGGSLKLIRIREWHNYIYRPLVGFRFWVQGGVRSKAVVLGLCEKASKQLAEQERGITGQLRPPIVVRDQEKTGRRTT